MVATLLWVPKAYLEIHNNVLMFLLAFCFSFYTLLPFFVVFFLLATYPPATHTCISCHLIFHCPAVLSRFLNQNCLSFLLFIYSHWTLITRVRSWLDCVIKFTWKLILEWVEWIIYEFVTRLSYFSSPEG